MRSNRTGAIFLLDIMVAVFIATLLGVALHDLSDQQRHMDQLVAAKLTLSSAAEWTARTLLVEPALAVKPGADLELSRRLGTAGMGSCRVQLSHQPYPGGLDAVTITVERKHLDRMVSAQMVVIVHAL
jgi:hypothetical protein